MAGFVQNLLWNSVSGFVDNAKRTGGEYAGNALIKAGDMIEGGGRSVGGGIEKKATGYSTAITGQTYQPSPKALPSTARKPVVKRSNSTPASNKPTTTGAAKSAGPKPVAASKYPGASQVNGAKKAVGGVTGGANRAVGGVTGGANKAIGGGLNTTRSTVGGVTNNANKALGGVVGGGQKALGGVSGNVNKTLGGVANNTPKPLSGVTNTATKSLSGVTNGVTGGANKALGGLPKPYAPSSSPYPSSAPKSAVKPGQVKPFTPPVQQKKPEIPGAKKAYPGTTQLPGQGSRTPVQNQKLKPLPRLGPQVGPGKEMNFLSM